MRRDLALPGFVSLLLAALSAWILLAPAAAVRPTATGAPVAAAVAQAGPGPAAIAHDVGVVLGRPLFSESRRPPLGRTRVAASTSDPRLSAIFVTPGDRSAVFDDGGRKPLVASVGGRAGPFEIVSIEPDRVVVDANGQRRTLRPTRKPETATADAGSATPTAPETGLSLLQQIQRGSMPRFPMPPPASIQNLMERLQRPRE